MGGSKSKPALPLAIRFQTLAKNCEAWAQAFNLCPTEENAREYSVAFLQLVEAREELCANVPKE